MSSPTQEYFFRYIYDTNSFRVRNFKEICSLFIQKGKGVPNNVLVFHVCSNLNKLCYS